MIPENQTPPSRVEEQINELQSKLAFQEDTVNALNEVVADQQQDILKLKDQMSLLVEELKVLLSDLDSGGISSAIEKPPHY